MKSKDWKDVKVHDTVIYVREDLGVYKAEITEVDIKIAEPLPTFHYDRPYGLTAETGSVKIKYTKDEVEQEIIENLANLIKWNTTNFRELMKAYTDWQTYLALANSYKETFLNMIQEKTAE